MLDQCCSTAGNEAWGYEKAIGHVRNSDYFTKQKGQPENFKQESNEI